jgi:hypothetical protein
VTRHVVDPSLVDRTRRVGLGNQPGRHAAAPQPPGSPQRPWLRLGGPSDPLRLGQAAPGPGPPGRRARRSLPGQPGGQPSEGSGRCLPPLRRRRRPQAGPGGQVGPTVTVTGTVTLEHGGPPWRRRCLGVGPARPPRARPDSESHWHRDPAYSGGPASLRLSPTPCWHRASDLVTRGLTPRHWKAGPAGRLTRSESRRDCPTVAGARDSESRR